MLKSNTGPSLTATLSFVITGRDGGVAKRDFQPKGFKLNLVKLKTPTLVVDDADIITELATIKRIDMRRFDVYNYNVSGGSDGSKLDKIIENPKIAIYSLTTPISQGVAEQFSGPWYPFTFNEKRTTLSAICDAVYKAQQEQMPGYEIVLTAVDLTRPAQPAVLVPPPKLQADSPPPKLQTEDVLVPTPKLQTEDVIVSPIKLQTEDVIVSPIKLQTEDVLALTTKQNKQSKRNKKNKTTKQKNKTKRNKKIKRNQKLKRNKKSKRNKK